VHELERASQARSQLLAGLLQHVVGPVYANELNARVHDRVEGQESRPGGAAEVIEIRAFHREIGRHLGRHALDLVIKRNRATDHVVEDGRGLVVEAEVGGGCRLSKDIVARH